jgi:hypothetical protein
VKIAKNENAAVTVTSPAFDVNLLAMTAIIKN